MVSTRALLSAVLMLWVPATSVQAQTSGDSLQVPTGALTVLEIPVEMKPLAMVRTIRVVYSNPRQDPMPRPVADFEQLLDALDRVERGLARTSGRVIGLDMSSGVEREGLRDTLDGLGLRLREQRRVYTVEPLTGKADIELRAILRKAGIDAEDIQRRVNAGESVRISPPVVELPLALPFETWADLFANKIQPQTLFSAIVRSRDASLLFYGVQAMTADTRAYLTKTPSLVRSLYERAAIVAAFGGAFRVGADGRVLVPGGAEAEELWEGLADQKVSQPDRFARELFGRDSGRLAYFADAIWALDEAHARFALGLWIGDRQTRRERFRALYDVFAQIDDIWSVAEVPFARPSYDASLLLSVLRLNQGGLLAAPSYRKLWARGISSIDLPGADDRQMREPAEEGIADAAFLAGLLAGKLPQERRLLIERVAFGQRCFSEVAEGDLQEVLVALRAFGRFPAAMLSLERIGVRQPVLFAQAARRAAALEAMDPSAALPLLAQLQGALALLERVARTGAVRQPALDQLVASLLAVGLDGDHFRGGIAEWLRAQLIAALPARSNHQTIEERLLDALVDRLTTGGASFSWEGQDFVVDAERSRRDLKAIRAKQQANPLDALLVLYGHTAALARTPLLLDEVKSRAAAISTDAAKLTPARTWSEAPGAEPGVKKVVERVVKDLAGIRKEQDLSKAARIISPLIDALDYLLGETLVALTYAGSLGDTGRGVASSVDISHRHLFGFASVSSSSRVGPWRRPARRSAVASADAVTGSLLGIDLALSSTRLRRLVSEGLPEAPRLNGNDRETMTETVALLNPRDLDDSHLKQIAMAIESGRRRVEQAASDAVALDVLAVEARTGPSRRGLMEWTSRHQSSAVIGLFSLAELFRLGGGQPSAVHALGTSHESLTGCFCVRLPDDAAWELTAGRPDTGQIGARIPELNLRVALLLADLNIPATLFPDVMAFATQDYIESVPLVHQDDWAALAGRASSISRERIEDYVSAVVASGPVRLAEGVGAR